MSEHNLSRRNFFGATAAGALTAVRRCPIPAARRPSRPASNPADLPDLTIKEVKVYVLKPDEPTPGRAAPTSAAPNSLPRS